MSAPGWRSRAWRAPVLLLPAFALLAPVRPAAAAPALRCTDVLVALGRRPPNLVFVGCRPLPNRQGRPLRATYRVDGRYAARVEAYLVRATGLARLRRSCGRWNAPPRGFIDGKGRSFALTMVSDETRVGRRAQWTLVRGFHVAVDAFTEET